MKRLALLVFALLLVLAPRARADGAFPDSLAMYAFADRPGELLVATNFGLLETHDDGKTWQWTCEDAILTGVRLYQAGAAPTHPLYALAQAGARVSADDACSWSDLGAPLAGGVVLDVFPDPTDEAHAFAIGAEFQSGTLQPFALYETHDTGASFTPVDGLPADDTNSQLVSVESAKTDPRVVYVTRTLFSPAATLLMRSDDGGATWTTFDVTSEVAPPGAPSGASYRTAIAAVDPDDAMTVYLRVFAAGGDELAVTHDGGRTVTVGLQLPSATPVTGSMSTFLRLADGSLVVGTADGDQYRSTDHGASFAKWDVGVHLRAIAQRGSTLYAAGNEFQDGFLVGESTDGGATWKGLLTYEQICDVAPCVKGTCTDQLNALRLSLGLAECKSKPSTPPVTKPPTGCGCAGASTSLVALVALAIRRRRRIRNG